MTFEMKLPRDLEKDIQDFEDDNKWGQIILHFKCGELTDWEVRINKKPEPEPEQR